MVAYDEAPKFRQRSTDVDRACLFLFRGLRRAPFPPPPPTPQEWLVVGASQSISPSDPNPRPRGPMVASARSNSPDL